MTNNIMEIIPLSAFKDNYIWILCDYSLRLAWAVDPGESKPVINFLNQHKLKLQGILVTHHHHDHTGGIPELKAAYENLMICGSYKSQYPHINHLVKANTNLTILDKIATVLEIPGHTIDHIAFIIQKALFCGDTLFSCGCGKIFEGTPKQMFDSLNKLAQLDEETKVYCGHEYTMQNLHFAKKVDPHNSLLQEKLEKVILQRENHQVTLPSTIGEEKLINPFLRIMHPEIRKSVENHSKKQLTDLVDLFFELRQWKNRET